MSRLSTSVAALLVFAAAMACEEDEGRPPPIGYQGAPPGTPAEFDEPDFVVTAGVTTGTTGVLDGTGFLEGPGVDTIGQPCLSTCDCPFGQTCDIPDTQGIDNAGRICLGTFEIRYCCSDPQCPFGEPCETEQGFSSSCGADGGVGGDAGGLACNSVCDCPFGFACGLPGIGGQRFCEPTATIRWCCTDPLCPAGEPCETPAGLASTCQ